MKITILSTAYPLRGGIAHFVGLLYKELVKNNFVNVITFKRQYPSFLFPGKSQFEAEDNLEKIPSEVLVDSINPFNWIKIGKKIKNDAPDLLIFKYWLPFFGPCFGTISKIARKNKRTKVLVICDNIIPHEKRFFDQAFTKFFLKYVDYFVVLSETVKKDLLSFLPKAKHKLLVHPVYSNFGNSVDKIKAKKKLNINAERVILFFGFIRDYKGLDVLLNAMPLLSELNVKLIVAGEFYSDKEKYLKLIDELEIKSSVHLFNDFIPTNEVKYYFSAADAVVLPYKSATQSGIVQIAVNFIKPVIAANVGGLGEVIKDGETGYIVEKETPLILAEAIKKFYKEEKEIQFTTNMLSIKEKYSWQNFTNGIFELVKQ
jgi:glycosyltransferase involved in cell wall biosynthesis